MKHDKYIIEYLEDVLSYENTLAMTLSHLLSNVSNLKHKIYVTIPSNKAVDIKNFKSGGISNKEKKYIYDYFDRRYINTECILIWDDVMAEATDSIIDKYPYVCINNEIYFYKNFKNTNPQSIVEGINFSKTAWHFIGIICENTHSEKEVIDNIINSSNLKENLKEIIIGAFDGEGFIHYYID
ncbi:hypothetical protein [Psychrobacter pygoscelis]|uniref:hypothetical protein n=1 Tax=Psychrobacter pygoscelis TaxID=2488563 RepID=UPI00103E5463|nr:hypothetical protein [Psychrobacter pygoscelis]